MLPAALPVLVGDCAVPEMFIIDAVHIRYYLLCQLYNDLMPMYFQELCLVWASCNS